MLSGREKRHWNRQGAEDVKDNTKKGRKKTPIQNGHRLLY